MNDKEKLIANADAEMRRVLGHPVSVQVNIEQLMGLVGLIQLACRHPKISDPMRQSAAYFVDGIGSSLQESGLHALASIIRAGWETEFDEVDDE